MRYLAGMLIFLTLSCSAAKAEITLRDISERFTPLFNKGQYDQIISEAFGMLNWLPLTAVEARMGCNIFLADSFFAKKEKEKAYSYLETAKEIAPGHMAPYYMEARLKTKDGKASEAYDQCRENSLNLNAAQGRTLIKSCLELLLRSRTVEAYKLWQDFKDNEDAAIAEYAGSLIAVRGKIVNIERNKDGGAEVTLSAGADKDGAIKCSFPESGAQNPNLAKIRILLISGLCRGMVENKYVLLSGCAVMD